MLRYYVLTFVFTISVIACLITQYYFYIVPITIIYLAIVVYGVSNLRAQLFIKSIYKLPVSTDHVALTFDDGPDENTPVILDILKENNIKASFFCIGRKIEERPEIARRIVEEGHLLANHSYNHKNNFPVKSTSKIKKEIVGTQQIIYEVTGERNLYFRPPFGVINPRIAKAVNQLNLKAVAWSIRSFDTKNNKGKTLKRITKNLSVGDIVLLHDTTEQIDTILNEVIIFMKKKNFSCVRVDTF